MTAADRAHDPRSMYSTRQMLVAVALAVGVAVVAVLAVAHPLVATATTLPLALAAVTRRYARPRTAVGQRDRCPTTDACTAT